MDNIGFDGTGVHSGDKERDYRNNIALAPKNPHMPDVVYEDSRIINAFYNRYCRKKRPLWKKVINTIYRRIGKPVPFVIKGTVYSV